jgi:receptor protein-tyrosine kinase
MVTSALAGEGKTFTSLNLAISIAQEQDLTVLLVDGDVANPYISDVFGVSKMSGLLDLLQGDCQGAESLVVQTDMKGLSILPAGAPRSDANELLSGSRMENIVQQLVSRFSQRIVIFDTPPLLQTSESKALASMAGQIVLVIKAESTSQGAVAEALQVLGGEKTVNLILNQSRTAENKNRYEYGYGYGPSDTPQTTPLKQSFWD